MNLNIEQKENSVVFQTGQKVMDTNGVVLFGMSPGNPFFKSRVIEDFVQFLGKENRRIIVVVPQQPAEHTYRAMGSKDAVKRARKNASQLKSHCRRAIEKVSKTEDLLGDFYMLDWIKEVDTHDAYNTALDFVIQFYNDNAEFRTDVIRSTAKVLGKDTTRDTTESSDDDCKSESSDSELEDDENIQEGVFYLLKELAFIISSKEMFRTDNVAVIYHRTWPVFEKFVNGSYDDQPKEGLGLAVINYQLQ